MRRCAMADPAVQIPPAQRQDYWSQVWRQLKNNARPWKPREPMHEPKVTLEKGMMGSYKLHVEGVKRTVQVKRVK